MTQWSFADPVLHAFSGRAPLFPLPNLVLFPNLSAPLHIFEPRYRRMTADALEGERLIGMAHLSDANADAASPAIDPIVGLGRIVAHQLLADGRYVLLLRGVTRARLIREESQDLPYRVGQLELCTEQSAEAADFDRRERADSITSLFCRLFPGSEFQRVVEQAMSADLPLGSVCDAIASALPIAPDLAQMFLNELNSDTRSQMLWQLLKQMETTRQSTSRKLFPPGFSFN